MLSGAFAPPLPGVVLPPKMDPKVTTYQLTIPQGKIGGQTMVVTIGGNNITVPIPRQIRNARGKLQLARPGDTFPFEWGNRNQVMASTLPTLPGTTVVEAKPMIFSNSTLALHKSEPISVSKKLEGLMQNAQTNLLQQSIQLGCNAVLSIHQTVSTDTWDDGKKYLIVTMVGTPCVIMPIINNLPVVEAEATVIPEFKFPK